MWCEFHKVPTHNTSECQSKRSLVVELKATKLDACSEFELETDNGNEKWKRIIDMEPCVTVAATKI